MFCLIKYTDLLRNSKQDGTLYILLLILTWNTGIKNKLLCQPILFTAQKTSQIAISPSAHQWHSQYGIYDRLQNKRQNKLTNMLSTSETCGMTLVEKT